MKFYRFNYCYCTRHNNTFMLSSVILKYGLIVLQKYGVIVRRNSTCYGCRGNAVPQNTSDTNYSPLVRVQLFQKLGG